MPAVMPPNGSFRSSTITHYESQTVYRLTRYINAVNTGYGGCGEAIHTHASTHILTHYDSRQLVKRKGDQTVKTGLGQFLVRQGVLTNTG